MRKNPQERYQSAEEMHRDLETCLQPQRINEAAVHFVSDEDDDTMRTKVVPALRPDMRNTMEAPAVKSSDNQDRWNSQGLEESKRRWIVPTVLGVLAIVLIGVLIWAVSALKGQIPSDVKVPTIIGELEQTARDKLTAAGLVVESPSKEEASETVPKGYVIDQSKKDIEVKEGSTILLTVSTGIPMSQMPDLSGKSFDDAKKLLMDMGINGESILPSPTFDNSKPGTVLAQIPKPDTEFDPKETSVTLTISKGEETIPMPNLFGMTIDVAKATIEKNNLKLPDTNVTMEASYFPKGTVFKQFPAEVNEMVTPGSNVSIWISSGYPADSRKEPLTITVSPTVEGKTSTIRIEYSDATGDNIVGVPRK